jgi:hypothetical protein
VERFDAEGNLTSTETYTPAAMASVFMTDPTDRSILGFSAGMPGGFTVGWDQMLSTNSTVIEAFNEQIIQSYVTAGVLAQTEADLWKTAINAGTATLGEFLSKFITPVP